MGVLDGRQILFEMIRLGNMVKVTAIDPVTRMEASIGAPAPMSEYSLKKAARRRLEYVVRKKLGMDEEDS